MKSFYQQICEMTPEQMADLKRKAVEAYVAPSPLYEYASGLLNPPRPRNSAGVATMARLMQRTRDERDFGGAVDDDA